MNIGILCFRPLGRSTTKEERRLREAAKKLGHKAVIFRAAKCQQVYDQYGERVFYGGRKFPKIDVLIPRASVISKVDIRLSVLKQFELMNVPVVNSYMAISRAKNKLRTAQILHSKGIHVPKTIAVQSYAALDIAIKKLGGAPVILKDPFGTYGCGVVIVESKRAARSVMDVIWRGMPRIIMVQEYIAESEGRDTRVFVVDGKVIGGMERSAQAEEFRSNVELGGEARAVDVSPEYAKLAIDSAKALGLEVAGVDIIEENNGPSVLEVNGNPGFKAFEAITGINVAGQIIEYAVKKVKRLHV